MAEDSLSGTIIKTVIPLKTLNADIMAGKGPDILVLDGLPIASYMEKGLLADLSDVLDELKAGDGCFENMRLPGVYPYCRAGNTASAPYWACWEYPPTSYISEAYCSRFPRSGFTIWRQVNPRPRTRRCLMR